MREKQRYVDQMLGIDREKATPTTSKTRKPDRFQEIVAKHRDRRARRGANQYIDAQFGIEAQESSSGGSSR